MAKMRHALAGIVALIVPGVVLSAGLPAADWVAKFTGHFITLACQEDSMFRACLTVSEAECISTAHTAIGACVEGARSEMPPTFLDQATSRKWGGKIGSCAGDNLENALRYQHPADEACIQKKLSEYAARAQERAGSTP
jgi:hypothetical protein